jgi:hypothetical protein
VLARHALLRCVTYCHSPDNNARVFRCACTIGPPSCRSPGSATRPSFRCVRRGRPAHSGVHRRRGNRRAERGTYLLYLQSGAAGAARDAGRLPDPALRPADRRRARCGHELRDSGADADRPGIDLGDNFIILAPVWPNIAAAVSIMGGKPRLVSLDPLPEGGWAFCGCASRASRRRSPRRSSGSARCSIEANALDLPVIAIFNLTIRICCDNRRHHRRFGQSGLHRAWLRRDARRQIGTNCAFCRFAFVG